MGGGMTLGGSNSDQIAGDHLQAFVERIERMHEEKKAISDDIAAIYAEAKGTGFNVKVLREVIRIRSKDAHERAEHETLLDLYMSALGMVRATRAGADE